MNTSELDCILSRAMHGSGCHFLGVYAADRAPTRLVDYPCAYVVNTDPATKPGQHWVAFYAHSPQRLQFFDSYGRPPAAYPHVRLPHNAMPILTSNKYSFQSKRSVVCGHYCIFYLVKRVVAGWSHPFILRTLRRFSASARFGLPHPQDALVRRFVRFLVSRLHIRKCITELHRCGGGQCCSSRHSCASS
jgi:hypothetical protein